MLAVALQTGGNAQGRAFIRARRHVDGNKSWLSFREGSGLVDQQRIHFFHTLERFGIPDQNAGARPGSDTGHDRHRRGKAKRARAGNDQH